MLQRPPHFTINRQSSLANGLVFAGLGGGASSLKYVDSSGYGNDGVLTNMDNTDWVWVPELGRWGLSPGGTNQIVDIPIPPVTVTPCTMAAWFNAASASTIYSLIDVSWYDQAIPHHFKLELSRGTSGRVAATTYASSPGIAVSASSFTANAWFHGCAVFASNVSRIAYLNGQPGSANTTALTPSGINRGTLCANRDNNNTIWRALVGYAADPLIYNRVLSPAEIQQLADPSNAMLSGLILPPRRKWWPVVSAPAFKPAWALKSNNLIGSGVA